MKKLNVFVLVLTLFISSTLYSQNFQNKKAAEICSFKKQNSKILLDKSPNTPRHSFDVLNYEMNFDIYNCFISPYPKSYTSSEIITFKVDSTLNTIKLNAMNMSLVIDSVRMAGASFTHLSDILTITLDATYNAGDTVSAKIYFHHKNIADDAMFVRNGMVFVDCEPERARYWWPCWDRPSDKALLDITFRVPTTVTLGSNGRLQDSTAIGNALYYHWISRDPISTYLVTFAGKVNYQLDIVNWVSPTTGLTTPIRFYYNEGEDPSYAESIIGEMTTYFSETFCEHPFEKNGFATLNQDFQWGGMENQTLTTLCPNCWGESLVAHEFAHQWFGDMITCATWADIWINEGWATFSEALWKEHTGGYANYKQEIDDDASAYMYSNPGWPISDSAWLATTPDLNTLFNYSITYAKGACVLHLLRYVLGDAAFFNVIHQYAADTQNFKYGNATIMDFAAKVNEVTGENYDWFFEQWIFQPNHPKYTNKYMIVDQGNGNWAVRLLVRQSQTDAGFFKMPVEVKINFADGTNSIVNLTNDKNRQVFTLYFTKQPQTLQFDPNNQIVLKTASTASSSFKILTVNKVGEGTTTPGLGDFGYDNNNTVSLTATPAEGYVFEKWIIGTNTVTTPNTSFAITANTTATAYFKSALIVNDTLIINTIGNGTVDPTVGTHYVEHSTSVTCTATAANCYEFVNWTVNGATFTENPLTFTINAHTEVVANFTLQQFTVSVSVNGQGEVSQTIGNHTVNCGDNFSVTATAASGWQFEKWIVNNQDITTNTLQINVLENTTIVAQFSQLYQLTISVVGSGTTTPVAGTSTHLLGTSVTLSATAITNWEFEKWVIDGQIDSSANTSVIMTGNKEAVAHFIDKTAISPISNSNFSVYPNPVQNEIIIELKNEKSANLQIINSFGETVRKANLQNAKTTINVSNLQVGVYIIRIETNKQIFEQKISVVK